MPRRALRYALAAALFGCGGGGTTTGPPAGSPDLAMTPPAADLATASVADLAVAQPDLTMLADLAMAGYPAGPYGANVGQTFPNLAWVGYVNTVGDAVSTTKPYGSYGAVDLYRSGRPYALVHISEFF